MLLLANTTINKSKKLKTTRETTERYKVLTCLILFILY